MPKQDNMRQKSTKIPLSPFCVGCLLLNMVKIFKETLLHNTNVFIANRPNLVIASSLGMGWKDMSTPTSQHWDPI